MNKAVNNTVNLIADIGGTNIRIAIADTNCHANYRDIETYQCADFDSLAEVIALYIDNKKLNNCQINACLAIACPVNDDFIAMTNLPWQFSQKELKARLKLNNLTFINDYTAIAMAIPLLSDEQKVKIGGGETVANKPIAVCGPGTGLGVANLVPVAVSGVYQWHCFSGEGGHVDFAAVDDVDIEILHFLRNIKQRVSYEQLLSGYGLEQIYQALCAINQQETKLLSAKDISTNALAGSCPTCAQALAQFCKVLGSFAGNLALTMNSQGGVYIAGGIVPRFVEYFKNSGFRARFETKGRLSHITVKTPTYVVTEQQPGLLGAAAYLLQQK
ncbi:MAG: glucokinase [Gammaproteobacteria bacterium]|nr:MAG: glucokinase [Gammaproteobacteria bacterium]